MSQKLAVFDLDGTLFRWQLYHALVYALKDKGCFPPEVVTELDAALHSWTARNTSFHDYEMQMIRLFTAHLSSIPLELFDATAAEIVKTSGHKIYNYTLALLKHLKSEGYHLLAISGSQQEIVDQFAKLYGFDAWIGSLYERDKNGFTGKIARLVPSNKHLIVTSYAHEHDFSLDNMLAIGDSGGDISLLEMAAEPIAFNPSEELLAVARQKGWKIVIERKNIAYTMQSQHGKLVVTDTHIY